MKKNAIISLANSDYFELLNELIDSIKRFDESKNVAICVLDAGLKQDQKNTLRKKVDEIKSAEWDIDVSAFKVIGKEWLKSQVSRAFLPKYFPNYEKYLWIDCDAWVNNWKSIELYFKACENGKLGITQTFSPGYKIMSKVRWLFGKIAIIKSQNFKHAISSKIDLNKARKLAFVPHINIGVFSMQHNSPCWKSWQHNLATTLKSGKIFGSEGLAINMSVYIDNIETEFLPLNCTWIASNLLPKYFPNYEKYLWIDCDAWVNDWKSIELYFKACENGKLGITQTFSPGYKIMSKVKWLFGKIAIIKSQNFKHAISSKVDLNKARKLAFVPHINIGVFSMQHISPCWKSWQHNLVTTLKSGKIFGSEGLAINMSVYIDNVETEFLPLNCNWIASNLLPKYDDKEQTFVEPYLPNYKIGIMHLAAGIWKDNKDMRLDKNVTIDIKNLDGNTVLKSLRFNQ